MHDARYSAPKAAVADAPAPAVDVQGEQRRLRWAANACLTFAAVLFFRAGTHGRVWVAEAVFVLLAIGIWRRSRVCAVLASLLFTSNIAAWLLWDQMNLLFLGMFMAIAIFLAMGTVAAFRIHRRIAVALS